MFLQGHIAPNWDIADYQSLQYTLVYQKNKQLNDAYLQSGHSGERMNMHNCFEDQLTVNTDYIRSQFDFLNNLALAVNYFAAGQYLPMHSDLYSRYKTVFGIESTEQVVRIVLMLQDCVPGQILQIEQRAIGTWHAGDWFGWRGSDAHAAYNLSMQDRYAVQITGTIC